MIGRFVNRQIARGQWLREDTCSNLQHHKSYFTYESTQKERAIDQEIDGFSIGANC